ncbi:hypothetical protein JYK00_03405 [Thermosipho ferrireducens]|uniref:DUF4129 domain-containing protein n=1 Tax=Thermosipho ferrireducens TaxID=2571116 RepID=A0ABX7S9E7_9BACT|nr:hypothetical protein [Thermosipho ferrireducens]QTA38573.1 hypothetical protein JYK00_03405 [Thermosipho ferrireducens]
MFLKIINSLIIILFSLSFWKVNLTTIIITSLLILLLFYKKRTFPYIIIVGITSVLFKNPIPALLSFGYAILKDKKLDFLILISYLIAISFFPDDSNIIYALIIILIYSLKEKKLAYLFVIIALITPISLKPYESIKNTHPVSTRQEVNFESSTQSLQNQAINSEPKNFQQNQQTTQKTDLEIKTGNSDIIFYIFTLISGVVTLLVLFKGIVKPSKSVLLYIFLITSFISILFLIYIPKISKNLPYQQNHQQELTESNSLTDNPFPPEHKSNQTYDSNTRSLYINLTWVFKIIIPALFAIIAIYTGVKLLYYSDIEKEIVQKNAEEKMKVWQSKDSLEELLQLKGVELVRRAYIYLRAKVFKNFQHLTPIELARVIQTPDLDYITRLFINLEYARKAIKINSEEFKNKLLAIVNQKSISSRSPE